jgi:hypothetical protein
MCETPAYMRRQGRSVQPRGGVRHLSIYMRVISLKKSTAQTMDDLQGTRPPPPYENYDPFIDSPVRPHYFGVRELLYAQLRWEAGGPRRLALAMMAQRRLGAHTTVPLPAELLRAVGEHDLDGHALAQGWYPPILIEHHESHFFPLAELSARSEFVRTIHRGGRANDWRVRLRHPGLNVILYDGPIYDGLQYVSPVAMGTHARLVLELLVDDRNRDVVSFRANRVNRAGQVENRCIDMPQIGTGVFRRDALPDSGELEIELYHGPDVNHGRYF